MNDYNIRDSGQIGTSSSGVDVLRAEAYSPPNKPINPTTNGIDLNQSSDPGSDPLQGIDAKIELDKQIRIQAELVLMNQIRWDQAQKMQGDVGQISMSANGLYNEHYYGNDLNRLAGNLALLSLVYSPYPLSSVWKPMGAIVLAAAALGAFNSDQHTGDTSNQQPESTNLDQQTGY